MLENWKNKDKGPIESELFNLTNGIIKFILSIWNIIKTFGLLLFKIYCWIAVIRMTPKLKPWVSFTIELVIFILIAMIPIFNLYVSKVQMRDRYSVESYQQEKKFEQELMKVEAESYRLGVKAVRDSLRSVSEKD